jgi:hypothetical protein
VDWTGAVSSPSVSEDALGLLQARVPTGSVMCANAVVRGQELAVRRRGRWCTESSVLGQRTHSFKRADGVGDTMRRVCLEGGCTPQRDLK